ncbi:hypothetical protein CPC08DRAFT_771063 [Agrocybe pediades]|nr:hypothetical protein CPC08DRAFT_771063 [Agrocybe pediades]
MKVRWSSTYIMLDCAEPRRVAMDDFVYELVMKETNTEKRMKTAALQLTDEEWKRVTLFLNLLGHADDAQQAFSSDISPTLFNALPAIERMYAAWEKALAKEKYAQFAETLQAGMAKLDEYYQKTSESTIHVMAILLHRGQKLFYFRKDWAEDLVEDVRALAEKKFSERYALLSESDKLSPPQARPSATACKSR